MYTKFLKISLAYILLAFSTVYASNNNIICHNNEISDTYRLERKITVNMHFDIKNAQKEDLKDVTMRIYNIASKFKDDPICALTPTKKSKNIRIILPEKDGWIFSLTYFFGEERNSHTILSKDIKMLNGSTFNQFLINNKRFLSIPSKINFISTLNYDAIKNKFNVSVIGVPTVSGIPFEITPMENQIPENFNPIQWEESVKNRGEMLFYKSFNHYKEMMNKEKRPLILVIGCGHNAFGFSEEKKGLIGTHKGYDCFSHKHAFTMNYMDGKIGPSLQPDINGSFPNDLPNEAKGQFDEIYFEIVNGGTTQYYKSAFTYLKPGGKLVDDGHGEIWIQTILDFSEPLLRAGFENVQFKKWDKNPHNLRSDTVVIAYKPFELVIESLANTVDKFNLN